MNATLLTAATLIALTRDGAGLASLRIRNPSLRLRPRRLQQRVHTQAQPGVIAALRKRFRDLQDDDIGVFYDGQQGFDVAFWTSNAKSTWHRACRLTLKPVKITNCRIVHG
jgi:hypothetical protein